MSSTDNEEPRRPRPNNESEDPRVAKLLSEKALPQDVAHRTDMLEPKLAIPNKDSADPMRM
jgi:hypothetical protein